MSSIAVKGEGAVGKFVLRTETKGNGGYFIQHA